MPCQGGLLVTLSFPDHCDGLALMNALEQTLSGGAPPPTKAEAVTQ